MGRTRRPAIRSGSSSSAAKAEEQKEVTPPVRVQVTPAEDGGNDNSSGRNVSSRSRRSSTRAASAASAAAAAEKEAESDAMQEEEDEVEDEEEEEEKEQQTPKKGSNAKKGKKRGRSPATPSRSSAPSSSSTLAVPSSSDAPASSAAATAASPSTPLRKSPRAAKPRTDRGFIIEKYESETSEDEAEDEDEGEEGQDDEGEGEKGEGEGGDDENAHGAADGEEEEEVEEEEEEESSAYDDDERDEDFVLSGYPRTPRRQSNAASKGRKSRNANSDDDDDGNDSDGAGSTASPKRRSSKKGKGGPGRSRASGPRSPKPRKPRAPRAPRAPKQPKPPKAGAKKKLQLQPITGEGDAKQKELFDAIMAAKDESMESVSCSVDASCCVRCSSRECFRAVRQWLPRLLNAACVDHSNVAKPFIKWSADVDETCMHMAIRNGNRVLVRRLLHELNMEQWRSQGGQAGGGRSSNPYYLSHASARSDSATKVEDASDESPGHRAQVATHNLTKSTGQASYLAYGHRVAQVNLSRGGREGNNAFTADDNTNASGHGFHAYFLYMMQQCKDPEMLAVFCQAFDPSRTKYEDAVKAMKPAASVPDAAGGKGSRGARGKKAQQAAASTSAAAASASNAASSAAASGSADASAPTFTLHTREDEVYRILSQQNGFFAAVECGNLIMARAAWQFLAKRSGMAVSGGSVAEFTRLGLGFNQQHIDALMCGSGSGSNTAANEKFKSASATKKSIMNHSLTPIHLAAINPDTAFLKSLWEVMGASLLLVTDDANRTAVFYAAVCSSPEPLKWLISKGANIFPPPDRSQRTPLRFAVESGAAHNIPLLVPQVSNNDAEEDEEKEKEEEEKKNDGDDENEGEDDDDDGEERPRRKRARRSSTSGSAKKAKKAGGIPSHAAATMPHAQSDINHKNKRSGETLLHVACKKGHAPTVAALIEAGADLFVADKEKRTPLVIACQQGHLEVVKVIHETLCARFPDPKHYAQVQKKQFLAPDKTGKLPLTHAVKNGHFELVKYLLVSVGSPVDALDTSDHNLVHYAAAYGWNSILKLLLLFVKHAQPNTPQADLCSAGSIWKTTPLFIAMIKGHLACGATVLSAPNMSVAIDARDSDGLVVLHHVLAGRPNSSSADQVERQLRFLVEEKNADCTLRDPKTGRNPLHQLAAQKPMPDQSESEIRIAELFLSKGLDINDVDGSSHTAMMLAMQQANFPLVSFFLSHGARVNLSYGAGGDVSNRTPLMRLLSLTRPKTKEEEEHEAEKSRRSQYYWIRPTDAEKAEQEKKDEEMKKKQTELDATFDEERLSLFRQLLEAAAKSSNLESDPVIVESKEEDKDDNQKSHRHQDEDESKSDDDEEEMDEDEYDEEKEMADGGDSSAPAAAAAAVGVAEIKGALTQHYLNGRDGHGCTLLFYCLRNTHCSLELTHSLLSHSTSLVSSGQNGAALDLNARDQTGAIALQRAAASEKHAKELVAAIMKYAREIASGQVEPAQASASPHRPIKKGKNARTTTAAAASSATAASSSAIPPSILDLHVMSRSGSTLLSSIGTLSSPAKALTLIRLLVSEGGVDLGHAGEVITLARKPNTPPNPPPADPVTGKQKEKFEWDAEELRQTGMLDGPAKHDCGVPSERIREMEEQLPHYTVTRQSFFNILLHAYFTWACTRKSGRALERVRREEAAWLQLLDLVLEHSARHPSRLRELSMETSNQQPHGGILHQLFLHAKRMYILPLLQLLVRRLPRDLLRDAANIVDRNGKAALLVLAATALPLPKEKPAAAASAPNGNEEKNGEDDHSGKKQERGELRKLLEMDLSGWQESDDDESKDKGNNDVNADTNKQGMADADAGGDEDDGEDEHEDEDEEAEVDEEMNEEDEEEMDDDGEEGSEEEQPTASFGFAPFPSSTSAALFGSAPAAAAAATAPPPVPSASTSSSSVPLTPPFLLDAKDVCEVVKTFIDATEISIDQRVEEKWHDIATLEKRKKKDNNNKVNEDGSKHDKATSPTTPTTTAAPVAPAPSDVNDNDEEMKDVDAAATASTTDSSDYDSEEDDLPVDDNKDTSSTTPSSKPTTAGTQSHRQQQKPRCQYWDRCYRKNPIHFAQFLHPQDLVDGDHSATSAASSSSKSDGVTWIKSSEIDADEYIIPEQRDLHQTFLHYACYHHSNAVAHFLVEQCHADVMAADYKQRIALHLCAAVAPGDDSIPRVLLSQKQKQKKEQLLAVDDTGAHALSICAQHSSKTTLATLLLANHAQEQTTLTDKNGRSALHWAVNFSARRVADESARGYMENFGLERLLLQHGADVNLVDNDGRCCLHYVFVPIGAIYTDNKPGESSDPIQILSDICAVQAPAGSHSAAAAAGSGADSQSAAPRPALDRTTSFIHKLKNAECWVKVDLSDKYGRTPLCYAGQRGARICVKYLMQRGASLATADKEGNGVFQHALLMKMLSLAVDLLDHKEIGLKRHLFPYTQQLVAKCEAVKGNDAAEYLRLSQMLQQKRLETMSAFGLILQENAIGCAYLALDCGLDITTAVMDALSNNMLSLVGTLIAKTAPSRLRDVDAATGRNLFHIIAMYRPKDSSARQAFEHTWMPKWLPMLIEAKVDPNAVERVYGYTPLHFACLRAHASLCRFLLEEQKVNGNAIGYNGRTPLLEAARLNHLPIVKLLHEINPNLLTRAKANGVSQAMDGTTALHWAVSHRNFALAHFLLQHGAHDPSPELDESKFNPRWYEKLKVAATVTVAGGAQQQGSNAEEEAKAAELLLHKRQTFARAVRYRHVVSFKPSHPQFMHPLSPLQSLLTPSFSSHYVDLLKLLLAWGADPNLRVADWALPLTRPTEIGHPIKRGSDATLLMYLALDAHSADASRLRALLMHQPDPVEVEAERKRLAMQPTPPPKPSVFASSNPPSNKRRPNDFNLRGASNRTILHYLVAPHGADEPSNENVDLLREVVEASRNGHNIPIDLGARDHAGRTAMDLALGQASGVMKKALQQLGARIDKKVEAAAKVALNARREQQRVDWSSFPSVDAAADAVEMENQEQTRLDALANDPAVAAKLPSPPVDPLAGSLVRTCVVYKDPNAIESPFYDIEMTCTEVNAGYWGKHSFYKMSVFVNNLQGLYILWTRWGRVGEDGQYQSTPFNTIEAACAEFEKIFKSKSGNNWQTNRTQKTFVPVDGKYVPTWKKTVDAAETLFKPIDTIIAKLDATSLPPVRAPRSVQSLVRLFTDTGRIHTLMRSMGWGDDNESIASKLTRSVLESAYEKLKEISAILPDLTKVDSQISQQYTLKQQLEFQLATQDQSEKKDESDDAMDIDEDGDEEMKQDSDKKDDVASIDARIASLQDEKSKLTERLSTLSNAFFQLVPQPAHRHSAIRAITTKQQVAKLVEQINQFIDLAVTKKLLLACQLKPNILHPIDYIYAGLGVHMAKVHHWENEFHWIDALVYNEQSRQTWEIYNIFRISRKGEDERFEPYKDFPNRQLLWHGSGLVNFCGILSQGLRIAPPEADVSGYAFGKGVYYADCFAKSIGYCREVVGPANFGGGYNMRNRCNNNNDQSDTSTKCLLLCEVALGNPYLAHQSELLDLVKIGPDCHSTHAIGHRQPDPSQAIVTPDGVRIPIGPMRETPIPVGWKPKGPPPDHAQQYHATERNEFIVYREEQCRMRYIVQVGPPRQRYLWRLKKMAEKKAWTLREQMREQEV